MLYKHLQQKQAEYKQFMKQREPAAQLVVKKQDNVPKGKELQFKRQIENESKIQEVAPRISGLSEDLDWIINLIAELEKRRESFYAVEMIGEIDKMLESWQSKLDPKYYRELYVKKVYSDNNSR